MTIHQSVEAADQVQFATSRTGKPHSKQTVRLYLYAGLLALDLVVIFGVPVLLSLLFKPLALRLDYVITMATLPVYAVIAANSHAYSLGALKRPIESVRRAVVALVMAQLSILVAIFFLKQSEEVSRLFLGLSAVVTIGTLGFARAVFGRYVRHVTQGRLVNELVLVDGVNPDIPADGYQIFYVEQLLLKPDLNDPQMLHRFGLLAKSFDRIMIASVPERRAAWALLLKGADIDGEILVDEANSIGAIGLCTFRGRDTLLVSRKPLSLANRAQKRALDLAVTVPLLVFLLPLMGLIALAIRLDDRGPVLFKQDRVGRGNCQFKVLKFRSMRVDRCDADGKRSTTRDDDRVTRVGRILRSSSLDELPQLFNVLLGDMSLVGPRPHALGSLAGERLFWEVDQTYWHRHQLKPGITGLAQIRGHRGATLQMSDLTDRLQADMEYVQGWDIWRDIGILLSTVRVVVHKNAF